MQPPPQIPVPAGARAVQEAEWAALLEPLRRFKGMSYNLRALLNGDCRQRYVDGETLVLVFKNAANRERFEKELEHQPSKQAFSEAVAGALGGELSLRVETGEAADLPNNTHGHLVRSAVSLGAKIIQEQEEPE
ncbi:MAG: hypothetical protein OXN15_01905 [Chloroflexota bacterium]|nr:hypothetical protein [Chloroflexota bacterium]